MNTELIESISKLLPEANRLNLPEQQLENYAAVKKCLLAAGGKYKRGGFDFTERAATLQSRLVGGEAIDDVKKYQYFPTPPELVARMLEQADIQSHHRVLEPSAGQGAIADELAKITNEVCCVELMPQNLSVLERKGYQYVQGGDFLEVRELEQFDRIVANPPFAKNQDIDHVLHMWKFLKPGGRMVVLMSPHHTFAESKKVLSFRGWLTENEAESTDIHAGAFKATGTSIATVMVVVDKRT